jgi:hypothetical protein
MSNNNLDLVNAIPAGLRDDRGSHLFSDQFTIEDAKVSELLEILCVMGKLRPRIGSTV